MFSPALPQDEDHFSPEADAAVGEMTRGAVLEAQVRGAVGKSLVADGTTAVTLCTPHPVCVKTDNKARAWKSGC